MGQCERRLVQLPGPVALARFEMHGAEVAKHARVQRVFPGPLGRRERLVEVPARFPELPESRERRTQLVEHTRLSARIPEFAEDAECALERFLRVIDPLLGGVDTTHVVVRGRLRRQVPELACDLGRPLVADQRLGDSLEFHVRVAEVVQRRALPAPVFELAQDVQRRLLQLESLPAFADLRHDRAQLKQRTSLVAPVAAFALQRQCGAQVGRAAPELSAAVLDDAEGVPASRLAAGVCRLVREGESPLRLALGFLVVARVARASGDRGMNPRA